MCYQRSGEVLCDVYAEELDAADPLHWSPVDGDGGGGGALWSEVVAVCDTS